MLHTVFPPSFPLVKKCKMSWAALFATDGTIVGSLTTTAGRASTPGTGKPVVVASPASVSVLRRLRDFFPFRARGASAAFFPNEKIKFSEYKSDSLTYV
jgi:hypothetical protein